MPSTTFSLSKETRGQLAKTDASKSLVSVVQYASTAVGLATSNEPQPNIALPGGLDWQETSASVNEVLESDDAPLSALVLLRYRSSICVQLADLQSALSHLDNPGLITINNKVLQGHRPLGDLVTERGTDHACEVRLYHSLVTQSDEPCSGPVFNTVEGAASIVDIDALAYCPQDATRAEVLEAVTTSVRRVLTAAFAVADDGIVIVCHYRIFGGGVAVTLVTPGHEEDENSNESLARRRAIHSTLMLPQDRPMLRRSCRAYMGAGGDDDFLDGGCRGRLSDVHQGIKSHGLGEAGVTEHLVEGSYLYCHYMQDKFNDSGWGCAYRSLQTILSWCARQKYASFAKGVLPTHEDIQKALVDVGDKNSQFIGSKEWIGANEVCYSLEHLTGVTSKILHVSRGSEIESKGRELAKHFDDHGSPVMVGGGVLAWTILGVVRNDRTGKTKFLILDPHYEGRDDLESIQNKGWIAWKGADVFDANAFYNLCMPQRPSEV